MLTKDTAICIRAVDYSETSQIVTFFTREHGKISAIAKGSKRLKSSFDGTIELFSYGQIVFTDLHEDKLCTLTEFQQLPTLTGLSRNHFVFNCALFGCELLNKLTDENDKHAELFDGYIDYLENIQSHKDRRDVLALLIIFELGLLKEIGIAPVLNRCVNCNCDYDKVLGRRGYFSHLANGLICRDCEGSFPDRIVLNKTMTEVLSDIKLIATADEKTLYQIERLMIEHFSGILGNRPRMAKHILEVSQTR